MFKISKYVLYDILRNKVVLAYTAFLLIVSFSLFQMEENSSKAVLSLLNIVLIVVPLVSLVFSTIHWYNSYEFIELMLTQPISSTNPTAPSSISRVVCTLPTRFSRAGKSLTVQPASGG